MSGLPNCRCHSIPIVFYDTVQLTWTKSPKTPRSLLAHACDFERMMRDRRVAGEIKYGRTGSTGVVDALTAAKARAERYSSTRNVDFLVDVANYCMLEFITMGGKAKDNRDDRTGIKYLWSDCFWASVLRFVCHNADLYKRDRGTGCMVKQIHAMLGDHGKFMSATMWHISLATALALIEFALRGGIAVVQSSDSQTRWNVERG